MRRARAPSAQAMATQGNEEDALEDFFASLDIADDSGEGGELGDTKDEMACSSGPSDEAINKTDDANRAYQCQKQSLIGRAEEAKSSWNEFNADKQGSSSLGGPKPISFSLNSKKCKKKKIKKIRNDQTAAGDNIAATGGRAGTFNGDSNVSQQYRRPRWTAVIDTCCLLDDGGECVRQILLLAKSAQCVGDADRDCALKAASLDDIRLAIPHVLWSELDAIVKRPQGRRFRSQNDDHELEKAEELSRRARGATRLLRDEMTNESAELQRKKLLGVELHRPVLLSQTLAEMKVASEKYLPNSQEDNIVNDDHILACALAYAAEDLPESSSFISLSTSHNIAGGAVILTNDQNLSCKALSNKVRVFSPEEFLRHISLRSEVRKDLLQKQRLPYS